MTAFHGKGGSVTFAYSPGPPPTGTVLNVLNWSVDAGCEIAESTVMTDTWKNYAGGFKNWIASVECEVDSAGLDPDLVTDFTDANGAMLTLSTGNESGVTDYVGTAIVIGLSLSTHVKDIAKLTYKFQGSGTLTETII